MQSQHEPVCAPELSYLAIQATRAVPLDGSDFTSRRPVFVLTSRRGRDGVSRACSGRGIDRPVVSGSGVSKAAAATGSMGTG
jgi:hypothetical protein